MLKNTQIAIVDIVEIFDIVDSVDIVDKTQDCLDVLTTYKQTYRQTDLWQPNNI